LRMFCVDLILVLISRPLAMVPLGGPGTGDRGPAPNREPVPIRLYSEPRYPWHREARSLSGPRPRISGSGSCYQLPVFLNSSNDDLKVALVSSSHLPVSTMDFIRSSWF